jgi:hypothetical protein
LAFRYRAALDLPNPVPMSAAKDAAMRRQSIAVVGARADCEGDQRLHAAHAAAVYRSFAPVVDSAAVPRTVTG